MPFFFLSPVTKTGEGKAAASCFGSVQEGEVGEPGAVRAWVERRSGAHGREEREEGERRKKEKKKRKKELEKKKKRKRDSRRRPRPDAHTRRSGMTRLTRANRETGQRWIRMSGPVFREIGR